MTDKIYLYHPLNTLKPFAKDIWIVDGDIIHMSFPLGIKVPFSTRMTIVRLQDGSLWCHSPIAPPPDLLQEINTLGKVSHLISPNKIHYAYIADWKKKYPQAIAWASIGVQERARSQHIEVDFNATLEDTAPPQWHHDFEQLIFKGSQVMQETVFFHRASRTLILADLIENFETDKFGSCLWANIMKLTGISSPDGKAPADWRATFKDKTAARESLAQILAWQPEKIILAHGRCYENNAMEELRRAFRWLD